MTNNLKIKKIAGILLMIVGFGAISWTATNLFLDDYTFSRTLPTKIEFKQSEIDMGKLKQGQPQTVKFVFQNTGENPLIMQQVETSCGCTEPVWPKYPIKPGNIGEIKVTYDAKYPGRFVKSITVFCNTEKGMEKLVVKGMVQGMQN